MTPPQETWNLFLKKVTRHLFFNPETGYFPYEIL